MEVEHHPELNLMYIWLDREKPQSYTRSLDIHRVIDYAEDGTPVGVELIDISHGVDLSDLPQADRIAAALREYKVKVLHA